MKSNGCNQIRNELVAFADGELTGSAADRVRRHVSECTECAALLSALQRSLAVAELIWTDAEVRADERRIRAPRRLQIWPAVLGAAAALALAIGLWNLHAAGRREPTAPPAGRMTQSAPPPAAQDRVAVAVLEHSIARAGAAAELLAAADYLARAPGGREYACEQYRYIARVFAGTPAAADSAVRVASLCEDHP
jgi:anti-sigma factor RsiW